MTLPPILACPCKQRAALIGLSLLFLVTLRMIKSLLVIVTLVLLLLFVFQRQLIFPIPNGRLPAVLPEGVTTLALAQGHALLMEARTAAAGPQPLLVFAHGNAELAHWSIEPMAYFTERGFHVLLLEYPGYAGSNGKPGRASIEAAALAAFDQAVAMPGIDAGRVVVYGRSIGGGAAALLAAQRDVAALVLESSFTSLTQLVYEKRMPGFLLRDRFDNEEIVAGLQVPVFLYHGTQDTLIPVAHSVQLHAVAPDAVLVTAPCGHNDCPRPWVPLMQFLQQRVL